MKKIKTPSLPEPKEIRQEIDSLRSRIGELKALLRVAEVQQISKQLRCKSEERILAEGRT
ncbi:MAG: hypothetical protein AABZ47_05690 [Planctomycetota bacterium]